MTSTSTHSETPAHRQILAASFPSPDGAPRAAAALAGAFAGQIGNIAILHIAADGTLKFVETKDWGSGRGALVGGLIGAIGGPLGVLAGSGLGILATKLRDAGFNDRELTRLGQTLGRNDSAVVMEISHTAIADAERILTSLDASEVTVVPLDSNVAALFSEEWVPEAS